MNVLLLKPINPNAVVIQPNLGLGYVASALLRDGHDVAILDCNKERMTWQQYYTYIEREQPDIIGIQVFTAEVESVNKHIGLTRDCLPNVEIWVGGAHISGNFYEDNATDIPNVDRYFDMGEYDYQQNLDDIPFPAWHLIPPASYPIAPHGTFCKAPPVAPIITSRGCPYYCTFCAGHTVTGRKFRSRSIDNILEEIELLSKYYNVREIHIEDDNFTLNKNRVLEFCYRLPLIKKKLSFALPNGVRLDTLDKEMLQLMERAGFYSMGVGIESGSDRILRSMKKGITTERIEEQVRLIKECTDIRVTGFFMMGYPGETEQEIRQTIDFAKKLPLNRANFAEVQYYPGTEIWNER